MAATRNIGTGAFDFGGYYTNASTGAAVTVETRIRESLALYAQGQIGWNRINRTVEHQAFGGLRLTW